MAHGTSIKTQLLPISIPSPKSNDGKSQGVKGSLWNTWEFYVYYAIIGAVMLNLIRSAYEFSSVESPSYDIFKHKLRPGWMFGRLIDLSDHQYRGFRSLFPLAVMAFGGYAILHRLLMKILRNRPLSHQLRVRAIITCIGLAVLHGFSSLKILAIVLPNYWVGRKYGESLVNPSLTWTITLLALYLMERHSFSWASIWDRLEFMDDFGGLYERWHVTFNISLLRLISYNMDYYYSLRPNTRVQVQKHRETCTDCHEGECDKYRVMASPPAEVFSLSAYFAYIFYLPLFIAGPIITFNNFVSQVVKPRPNINVKYIALYAVRLAMSVLTLETILHFLYVNAIKETSAWTGFTPFQFCSLGFYNLMVVWLKLLFIWRFFRLIALLDGIDPPENMIRCIADNYSCMGFWRGWHRSFNLWIIRYMYIPMGGSSTAVLNVWPIFMFVALWHDFVWRMVGWAVVMCLFLVPEIVAGIVSRRVGLDKHRYWRHISGFGSSFSLLQIIIVNLLGFGLGIEGTRSLVRQVLSLSNIPFIILLMTMLFAICQVAFEVRECEKRNGIFRNY